MDQEIKIEVGVSVTEFERLAERMSTLLKSGDVLELIPQELLGRFKETIFSGRADEISELVGVTTPGTSNILFEVKFVGVMKEMIAALRALGFQID